MLKRNGREKLAFSSVMILVPVGSDDASDEEDSEMSLDIKLIRGTDGK